MNEGIRAQILNLSASILLGKATEAEIEKISRMARDGGEFEFFAQEIKDCDRILRKC